MRDYTKIEAWKRVDDLTALIYQIGLVRMTSSFST